MGGVKAGSKSHTHSSEYPLVVIHAGDISRGVSGWVYHQVSCAYTEHGEKRTVIDRAKLSVL